MLNNPNQFCFVYGKFTSKEQRNITHDIKKMYLRYFGCPLADHDMTRAPHKIFKKCCLGLHNWLNKRSFSMPFAVPLIWREPKIIVRIAVFVSPKQKAFSLNRWFSIFFRRRHVLGTLSKFAARLELIS